MKRTASLLALIIITNLPISCGLGCGPFDTRPNIIVSISSDIGSVAEGVFSESVSTDFNTAAIRAVVDETHKVGKNDRIDFSFASIAYACSPPSPNVQHINSISLISDSNIVFDGIEYQSGENLSSFFKIVSSNGDVLIEQINDSPDDYRWFFSFTGDSVIFQLLSKPDSPIAQKFTFTFTFDDGLEYQVQTPLFTVN